MVPGDTHRFQDHFPSYNKTNHFSHNQQEAKTTGQSSRSQAVQSTRLASRITTLFQRLPNRQNGDLHLLGQVLHYHLRIV